MLRAAMPRDGMKYESMRCKAMLCDTLRFMRCYASRCQNIRKFCYAIVAVQSILCKLRCAMYDLQPVRDNLHHVVLHCTVRHVIYAMQAAVRSPCLALFSW